MDKVVSTTFQSRRQTLPTPGNSHNKFIGSLNAIDNNIRFAEALDKVKSRLMIKINPNYPSSLNTSIGMAKGGFKTNKADEPTPSQMVAESTEADDLSILTESNLSQLTLE